MFRLPKINLRRGRQETAQPSAAESRLPAAVPFLAWTALYLAITCYLHFGVISVPVDADSYYHVAVGRLISRYGMLHTFPWTPFSWLSTHYADKELLFHLLFVPLASLPYLTALRVVGTLLGTLLLALLYLMFRSERVRFAGLWPLLLLVACNLFTLRFAMVRPHLLAICLALPFLWSAARRRYALLFLVALLYPLSYVAFWQLPAILLSALCAAQLLSGRGIDWKCAAFTLAGIAAGLALHPNALNLVQFNWICMADVLFKGSWQGHGGMVLGKELLPFTPSQWGESLLGCVAMTCAGLFLGWRHRKEDPALLAFALAAVVFSLLTVRSGRFQEYFVPFSVVTAAFASRFVTARAACPILFAASLVYQWHPLASTRHAFTSYQEPIPPDVAAELQQIPVGAQVFTTEWDYTGNLMLSLPERKFMVALDPTLFARRDPELYRLWYELPRQPRPGMAEIIRRRFGARYVVSFWQEEFGDFYYRLGAEPGVKTIVVTDHWMAYDLGGR